MLWLLRLFEAKFKGVIIPRSKITMIQGKSSEYKSGIYKSIYDAMCETFNVSEDDQFMSINLVGVDKENWSFGHGEAQYA